MKKVEIDIEEYRSLLEDEAKLRLLEFGGVDNWNWYDESLEDYDEELERIDEIISSLGQGD